MSKAAPAKSRSAKKAAVKVVVADIPALLVEDLPPAAAAAVVPAPPVKRKSTKKPAVVAAITPDGIIGDLTPATERRPLIAHLPISGNELESDLFGSDQPETDDSGASNAPGLRPFEAQDAYTSLQVVGTMYAGSGPTPAVTTGAAPPDASKTAVRPSLPLHYAERLMVRFQDANREQVLPESTDVACFWDCSPFRGSPCVIPYGIEEDVWRVYGNFCCPECAAAFLFSERLDSHVQWERYALMNRLYAANNVNGVRLAPPRTALRLFGGQLEVSDYRAAVSEARLRIDVMTPPMISIIQVMDTKPIDFYDASIKNNFIPWEMDRQNRPGAQGLRLRRTKPVADRETTLEFCMGIQAV